MNADGYCGDEWKVEFSRWVFSLRGFDGDLKIIGRIACFEAHLFLALDCFGFVIYWVAGIQDLSNGEAQRSWNMSCPVLFWTWSLEMDL
ncbi:hypothetical protein SUGI_0627890 [Cryptomeria japonica]|nr:hypothetical protein SUGI_0627890 [Cryptomeria japonica]